jgi:hypothetical protein
MTRSIASLERRAAKRNLSVKEMKVIEVSRTKKPKIQESTVSLKPDNEPEGERWICDVCNNSNLTKRSKDLCNRCQRPRPILIPQCPPVKTSEKTRVQPNSTNIKLSSRSPALQRQSLTQNTSQWKIEKPSEDQLLRNQNLRERYLDEELRKDLSETDIQRAKILIERSERKKLKKVHRKSKY